MASPTLDDGSDLRERVLRASVELVREQGLGALSMREVARRAGVSHQAPYHYFPDRESILAAVCERGFSMLETRIRAAREGRGTASERMQRAAHAYVEFALEQPAYFRVMFRPELVHLEKFAGLQQSADCAFEHVPSMVAACIEEGLPATPNASALVVMAWSFVHGLACLLVDGPLEAKMAPHGTSALIRDAVAAFGRLIDVATASSAKGPAKKTPRSKAGAPARRRAR